MKNPQIPWTEATAPSQPLVYFLTDDQENVVYVGKTDGGLYSRFAEHYHRKEFIRVFFIAFDSMQEAALAEVKYVSELKPKYNLRLDKPEILGYLTPTFVRNHARNLKTRRTWGYVRRIARQNNVQTIQINDIVYYHKSILNLLK